MITRQQVASVLKSARKAKGLTQLEVAKELGKSQQTIAAWESAQAQPDANTLFILCKLYGTTVDEAFGFNSNRHVTPTEMEHIKKYRALDEHGKTVVDGLLSEEYKRMTNNKVIYESDIEQEELFADIPFYSIGASAGTGLWLFDDIECITIQIPYTDESRRADFALPVRGDSMEPKYHDGDLLLVRQQPAIDIGEIGIFVLNDEGYVKKQGEHELISLNDNYDNINVSEFDSIYCKGKVVGCILAEEAKKYLP